MTPTLTQADRPFAVHTPLGEDALVLQRFRGVESVSRPFQFRLSLLSEDANVDAEKLLGRPASVTLELEDGDRRVVHGRINRFVQRGGRDKLAEYQADLVPWLWFLTLASDCRVYQHQSVPEIVESVFRRNGFEDFERRLVGTYPQREYCVQYRESDLDFVSRLLEDEGIFYFFQHEANRHVLVLADSPSAVRAAWGKPRASMAPPSGAWHDDSVLTLRREHAVRSGRVTLASYDYLKPSQQLRSSAGKRGAEVYDYPAHFVEHADGDRYARIHLEMHEAKRQTIGGKSTCRAFQSGACFTLERHSRRDLNKPYQLLTVRHAGRNPPFLASNGKGAHYANLFEAIPGDVPYRPPRITPRPLIRGTESAVVVGSPGEEIWTDSHARVKIQFHWDRQGRRDQSSSCWVRVASPWAGKGWGSVSIPRIGQEVLVDFLGGDPDRPIITGKVYNGEQTPPCNPGGKGGVVSGLRSKTHRGGGANWIEMHDTTGDELFDVNAQYNMKTNVGYDRTETIGNNETIKVGVDRTETVGNNETITIASDRTESVGANETGTVAANRSWNIGAADSLTVGGMKNETVALASTENVGLAKALSIGGAYQISVGAAMNTTVMGAMLEEIGFYRMVKVGSKFTLDAASEITLKSGGSSITMKDNGEISIEGKNITIKGSSTIVAEAEQIDLN